MTWAAQERAVPLMLCVGIGGDPEPYVASFASGFLLRGRVLGLGDDESPQISSA